HNMYPSLCLVSLPDALPISTAEWRECCLRALSVLDIRMWAPDLIASDDPALVEAIRNQVLPRRGIWAEEDEIMVTLGAQHALYLDRKSTRLNSSHVKISYAV